MFSENPITMSLVVVVALIALAAFILLIWLAIVSQIAVVNNTDKILKSRKDVAEVTLHTGILAGIKSFWSVLWLNLVSKVVINILVLLVSLPLLFMFWNKIFTGVIYILLFVIFIPIAVAFSLMIKYAIAFVVLKKQKFSKAFVSAWHLFKENWIVSLEVAFILFAISFFATIVILLAVLFLAMPFFFLALAFLSMFTALAFWSVVTLAAIILVAFVILCGSILSTYQVVAWTNLFNHLGRGIESKIERLVPESVKNQPISFK